MNKRIESRTRPKVLNENNSFISLEDEHGVTTLYKSIQPRKHREHKHKQTQQGRMQCLHLRIYLYLLIEINIKCIIKYQ